MRQAIVAELLLAILAAAGLGAVPARSTAGERSAAGPWAAFLQRHCVACHGAEKPEGALDLSRLLDESALLAARRDATRAVRAVRNFEMPPKDAPQPTPDERDAFVSAVQETFRRDDAGRPIDPGPTVVRRLNRAEYGRTIRDLCRIEFDATELLPPDDANHGFDNDGESLVLSPVLLERYLDAAEVVVARMLGRPDPANPRVRVGFEQFSVSGTKLPYRVLLFDSTPLEAEFRLAADGDYLLRIEGRTNRPELPVAEVAVRIDGRDERLLRFEPPAKGPHAKFEIPLVLGKGKRRIGLSYRNADPTLESRRPRVDPAVDGPNRENHPALEILRLDLVGPTNDPSESRRTLLECDPQAEPRARAREILARFARRAFRRPLTTGETDPYVAVFEAALTGGREFETAVGIAVQAVLVSPHFLFRLEFDGPADARPAGPAAGRSGDRSAGSGAGRESPWQVRPISEHALASRLSYLLWSSLPDEKLSGLADRGDLSRNLAAQLDRLLADGKSEAFVERFAPQWLGIDSLERVERGERFDVRMREAMLRETTLFFEAVLREDRPLTDFLDGRYTFVNDRLARHYRLGRYAPTKDAPQDETYPQHAFVRVALSAEGPRGGILTHAGILTVTSAPDRTSPVKRGAWILEHLLASPPPPPPANVPPLEGAAEKKPKDGLTLRARLERHRAAAECAGCHAKIDPLGFPLERFDMLGQDRLVPGGKGADDTAELPGGRTLKGVEGLRSLLRERQDEFARCLTEKLFAYALGRPMEDRDAPAVEAVVATVARDGNRFRTLLREVVHSPLFRMQRVADDVRK